LFLSLKWLAYGLGKCLSDRRPIELDGIE
jgi:hypothetical protein